MAVKGYTNSELAKKKQEKLMRITVIIGGLHLLLSITNIVLAIFNLGIIGVFSFVIYIVLYGIYVRGADMLAEQGSGKTKILKRFKIISVALYAVSFCLAIFSSMS
jgi:hypothetical protein